MDARFAENLVRKWQTVKSLALGPDHCLGKLSEVRNLLVMSDFDSIVIFLLLLKFGYDYGSHKCIKIPFLLPLLPLACCLFHDWALSVLHIAISVAI